MMHRFPTRAAALRSLKDISIDAIQHAKNLITEEDGMFCFDEDTAEQYLCSQTETQENIMTEQLINIKTASTKELVEFYNLYVESSIKKFRDRATAERKCQEILDAIAEQDAEEASKNAPVETKKEAAEGEDAYIISMYGYCNCPKCGVHLSNGVGHHGQEVNGKVIKHEKYEFECLACGEEFGPEIAKKTSTSDREASATQAETMKTTLKLDRTIEAFDDQFKLIGSWKNAYQMWKANPSWMTSSQQDSLTAKLYKAAKESRQERVEINGRTFQLVNV